MSKACSQFCHNHVRNKQEKHVSTYWHDGKLTPYVQVLLKIIDVYKFHGHLGNVFSGNGHMEMPAREMLVRTTSRWHVTRGTSLLYRDYAHNEDRKYGTKQHWRCVHPDCPGRIHTINVILGVPKCLTESLRFCLCVSLYLSSSKFKFK